MSANSRMVDLRPDEWLLSLAGNVRLVVPADIGGISSFVFLEQEDWFEDEAPFVRALAPHLRMALDIGANLGFYAATLAAARVATLAFEPQPALADKLRRSAASMPGVQLSVFEVALGDTAGEVEFGGHRFHEGARIGAGGGLRVPLRRLDDLLPPAYVPAIDFVKIDVEGAEVSAIGGATRLFEAGDPLVMVEIRDGTAYDFAALKALEALGYARYRLVPGLNALVPMGEGPDSPDQLNAFAAKPSRVAKLASAGLLAGERYDGLLRAHATFEAKAPSLARDLSLARACADLGRRQRASQLLAPHVPAALAGTLAVPDEPFACPLERYEGRTSPTGKRAWLCALVLEAFHELAAPSSLFAPADGREAALEAVIAAGIATPATVRRLHLYRLALGRKAAKAPHPLLVETGPSNLNAAFWRQPQLYG
ncbi:MAG: FkbM family methyltransferase [Rhodospirillales bacterium]|nr:FkbM family methyltransferase [Rhodospirillales bacterium]